jgi:hypothetical protein
VEARLRWELKIPCSKKIFPLLKIVITPLPFPPTYRRLSVALMLLALVQCMGMHWMGFYAASRAIHSYQTVRAQGLVAALERLPQGRGNCGFCKKIQAAKMREAQQKQQQQTTLEPVQTWAFTHEQIAFCFTVLVCHVGCKAENTAVWHIRSLAPPTPPPKFA